MELSKKISLISEALDTDSKLVPETKLETIEEWDSMGVISIIAMLDKHFDIRLKVDDIENLKTVDDVLKYMV